MVGPLLLLIFALILTVIGLLACFGSPFASPSPAQRACAVMAPVGAVIFLCGAIWLAYELLMRWLT